MNKKILFVLSLIFVSKLCNAAISLGTTRLIYNADEKQTSLLVSNNDENSFLIQSWIENKDDVKTDQFFITPPLFAMHGKKEHKLRVINTRNDNLSKDRESLFWVNVKAIPSTSEDSKTKNTLQIAIVSKIKMFYRPLNLTIGRNDALKHLSFTSKDNVVVISNNSPYYITFSDFQLGREKHQSFMVEPYGVSNIKVKGKFKGNIKYKTINDYGSSIDGSYTIK